MPYALDEITFNSETDRLRSVSLILAALSLIPLIGFLFGAVALVLIVIRLVKRRNWRWTAASALVLVVAGCEQAWILDGGLNWHLIPS